MARKHENANFALFFACLGLQVDKAVFANYRAIIPRQYRHVQNDPIGWTIPMQRIHRRRRIKHYLDTQGIRRGIKYIPISMESAEKRREYQRYNGKRERGHLRKLAWLPDL